MQNLKSLIFKIINQLNIKTMSEGLFEFIFALLNVANEAGALSCGYKGKPCNYYDDVFKEMHNIRKQDKKKFEEIYKRIRGEEKSFDDIVKDNLKYVQIYQKGEY